MSNIEILAIIPDTFTARVRSVPFMMTDIRAMPTTSLAKIFEYGLQRIMNDACASAKTGEEATALAYKRWENLQKGVIRATAVRTSGDPVEAEGLRLALAQVHLRLAERGKSVKDVGGAAEVKKLAQAHYEKNRDAFVKQAKANLAAASSLEIEVDLGDL